MSCKSSFMEPMNLTGTLLKASFKLGSLILLNSVNNLLLRIYNKGPELHNLFVNGSTLKGKQICWAPAVNNLQAF